MPRDGPHSNRLGFEGRGYPTQISTPRCALHWKCLCNIVSQKRTVCLLNPVSNMIAVVSDDALPVFRLSDIRYPP